MNWRERLCKLLCPLPPPEPPVIIGRQEDRYVGRGWAPWPFIPPEAVVLARAAGDNPAYDGTLAGMTMARLAVAAYTRDRAERYILPLGENAVRFNGWRAPWGANGLSFHLADARYRDLARTVLHTLADEGITAIVSCSQHDEPSRYGQIGGVCDLVTAKEFGAVAGAQMYHRSQDHATARRMAAGSISAFAPWIPVIYDDLMANVKLLRDICPPGTIAELFNERPAPWEFSPFVEADAEIMAGIFGLEVGSFNPFKDYADMYADFSSIWNGRTIQGFVEHCPFFDKAAWGHSMHPYARKAHEKNILLDSRWRATLESGEGDASIPDCICEIGVTDTCPTWPSAIAHKEVGVWKYTTGEPNWDWHVGDRVKVLKGAVRGASAHIWAHTGAPPKVLIGWSGHAGGYGLNPLQWEYEFHLRHLRESGTDLGFRNLSVRPEMRRAWAELVAEFWNAGVAGPEVYSK